MRRNFIILTAFATTVLGLNSVSVAQSDKVQFGGYARAWQENNNLGGEDTVNTDKFSRGHTLIDLGVNLHPDRNTQIQALFRFRTELGGFFGASASAQLRQLFVKGNIAKVVGYEVGDIYVQMSPYTFYNSDGDSKVNEATVFGDIRRDFTEYDNLNRGNRWWQQGAHVDWGLQFNDMPINTIKFDALFLRNRLAANGLPARFHSGGRIAIEQSENLSITGNYINLFEVGATVNDSVTTSNPVTSIEIDYALKSLDKMDLTFDGEVGMSSLVFKNDILAPTDVNGVFFDLAAGVNLKNCGLKTKLGYRYTDPRFYSSAAQTKRINFDSSSTPQVFKSVANNPFAFRSLNLFDLTREAGIYNQAITEQLMSYDPRYGNVTPYGVATPNRAGIYLNTTYSDSLEKVKAFLNAAVLSEAVPTNSTVHKSFLQLRTGATLSLSKMLNWQKNLKVNLGAQYESTTRDDGAASADLTSTLVDIGLDAEVATKLDILIGAKILLAQGSDILAERDQYNEVTGAGIAYTVDNSETLLGYGLKYRFSKGTYLSAQHNLFSYVDVNNSNNDYSFNQFLIFFNMSI